MKQVININFQGRVVPIEVTAFEILKVYTESLARYFANEEGKDEIINDIESRIGELFQERLKAGTTCITDDDVNAIIRSMGRPEDFETSDAGSGPTESNYTDPGTTNTQSQTFTSNTGHKRLFRNENDKVIGGVCSGLAAHFGIDVAVVRVIFVVLAVLGFGILSYIILWVAVPSSATMEIGATRKKLYRDNENKLVAGVCSGIGSYFGVNPWIPRVFFLLPFLGFISGWNHGDFTDFLQVGFSPGSLIIYIILWLVIPEALSTTEKLEMKGEKVDMNSIKNSIVEEMKGVQERAQKFSKQASTVAGEKSKAFAAEAGTIAKRGSRSLGDIIAFLFKIVAYSILGCIGIAVVVLLFVLAGFSIQVFPLKDFVLTDGWQNAFAWGTLIFFIAVPIIGLLAWLIRRLAKMRNNSKTIRLSFIGLWIIGWFSIICLIASVSRDFKASNTINEEDIVLANPSVNKLEITSIIPTQKIYRNNWFRVEPFDGLDEDTAYVGNVRVHITKSPNDSFRVTILRLANGRTKAAANKLAGQIEFNMQQKDSLLIVDKGIPINRIDKFRNQRVVITVYVPVGKQIMIDESVRWGNNFSFEGPFNSDWDINFDDVEEGWETDTYYIMKENGLFTLDGKPADEWKYNRNRRHNNDDDDETDSIKADRDRYHYYNTPTDSITKIKSEQDRLKDSIEKNKQILQKEVEQKIKKDKDPTAFIPTKLPGYNPLMILN